MQELKVSIIMATYNRAHFILETLTSIRNQTYQNWECLIVDDGGSDNTQEVISKVLQADTRFKYLRRPERYLKGLPGSRNYGLDLAEGDYIVFFDDDDIVHPCLLETTLKVLETKNVDFCLYQKQSFEKSFSIDLLEPLDVIKTEPAKDDFLFKVVTQQIGMASCTVLWKSSCFDHLRFNEHLQYAEEWECFVRVLLRKPKGVVLLAVLYYNRKHSQSNTGEYWSGDNVRRVSKKKATLLIINNLKHYSLLDAKFKKFFLSSAFNFKDKVFFRNVVATMKVSQYNVVLFLFRHKLYVLLKSLKKKIS
ncbi:glycosyltransferase family 2 protein [Meridianimaribacter flavus]|uniref:Glycosyltransferase involved in cell wall biosynthesis n=1 Tax=Meridianimaribacter flavus TaxID=571115 RepID=A0ABY2G6K7_9FLAO|nr:glycosyltransferase family 2 protein [Meridianimaribacter flavus]TDY11777.1 glycosyltransferase involved in cell wall biosynthesis [Meridianimaribacter flavus]